MDLLQTLLGSVPKNEKGLEAQFTLALEVGMWNYAQLSSFHFLQGCYNWIKGNRDLAIELWTRTPPRESDRVTEFKVRSIRLEPS
jgi:hypothetical protein